MEFAEHCSWQARLSGLPLADWFDQEAAAAETSNEGPNEHERDLLLAGQSLKEIRDLAAKGLRQIASDLRRRGGGTTLQRG